MRLQDISRDQPLEKEKEIAAAQRYDAKKCPLWQETNAQLFTERALYWKKIEIVIEFVVHMYNVLW